MLTRASWKQLPKGSTDRAIAKIAHIANGNTWHGGVSAMVKADRARAMGLPSARDLQSAVADVYSTSSGKTPDHLTPFECPECGSVHLGRDAASECCAMSDESFETE